MSSGYGCVRFLKLLFLLAAAGAAAVRADPAGPDGAAALAPVLVDAGAAGAGLQELPMAAQSLGRADLDGAQIHQLQDLNRVVPGFQLSTVGGFPLLFFRGLGADYPVPFADPDVAVYIDGIYTPMSISALRSLDSFGSVDFYKGPQGTLFGREATAGAILLSTAQPGRHPRLQAMAEGGAPGRVGGRIALDGAVSDFLSASMAATFDQRSPLYQSPFYRAAQDRAQSLRFKFNLHLGAVSAMLAAYAGSDSGPGHQAGNNIRPSPLAMALGITPQPDDFVSRTDAVAFNRSRQWLAYGGLWWDSDWGVLKLLGSVQNLNTPDSSEDFDSSPRPLAVLGTLNNFDRLQTFELQWMSREDSAVPATGAQWVAGFYHLHGLAGADPGYFELFPALLTGLPSAIGMPGPGAQPTLLQGLPGGVLNGSAAAGSQPDSPLLDIFFHGVLATDSNALYGDYSQALGDHAGVELGLRAQQERRALIKSSTDLAIAGGSPMTLSAATQAAAATSRNLTPRIVLSAAPAEDLLLYGSYASACKSATANIVNVLAAPVLLPSERVSTQELGAKWSLPAIQGWLDLALYDSRIHNLQSGVVSLFTAGSVDFYAVPRARVRGGEIESRGSLRQGSYPSTVVVNAGYVDAHYGAPATGPGFDPVSGLFTPSIPIGGHRVVHSPLWSGQVELDQGIRYSHAIFEAGVSEYLNSGYFANTANSVREAGYALLGGHLDYRDERWKTRVTLSAVNLLDHRYHALLYQSDFGTVAFREGGRTVEGRISWSW